MKRTSVRLLAGVAGLAVLGGAAGCSLTGGDTKTLTAHFDRTVGLYKNSDVRILGIRVGQVTSIVPEGKTVKVEMEYDAKYKVPAGAQAVVVAPSVVSDRYVQLTPTYKSGAQVLATNADIPEERTAVPVELDQILGAVNQLNVALGPNGANKNGALSDLLATGAKNLDGNGQLLGTTLTDLSTAVSTLADQRDDLFGTIRNLQDFTTTIKNSDSTVRRFNADLAEVADQLAGERQDLATAIRQLAVALADVSTFVRDNKNVLTADVKGLADVTKVLVTQKKALEEFLDTAPTALSNLQLAYNPASGTLDSRTDQGNGNTTSDLLCSLVKKAVPTNAQQACDAISGALGQVNGATGGKIPVLPGASGSGGSSKPSTPSGAPANTLLGLLGGNR